MIKRLTAYIKIEHLIYGAWAVALIATCSSWVLSEVFHLTPCILCWMQRIFMYPLAVIMPVGILRKDPDLPYYVLPLSLTGTVVAFYHSLLQWDVIPEAAAPCVNGVSCATKQIEVLGFATIPFASFMCFLAITIVMLVALRRERRLARSRQA
ncbi:MAG TPA: disulfide bond formation protein B [Candidatus Saccharimonadia bacterium]